MDEEDDLFPSDNHCVPPGTQRFKALNPPAPRDPSLTGTAISTQSSAASVVVFPETPRGSQTSVPRAGPPQHGAGAGSNRPQFRRDEGHDLEHGRVGTPLDSNCLPPPSSTLKKGRNRDSTLLFESPRPTSRPHHGDIAHTNDGVCSSSRQQEVNAESHDTNNNQSASSSSRKTGSSGQFSSLISKSMPTVEIRDPHAGMPSGAGDQVDAGFPQADGPMSLQYWGVPAVVAAEYAKLGVKQLYPWQRACLEIDCVTKDCGNLIYSAPTSAGKTLVAEILMIRQLVKNRKKVMFVLPYVALAEEKANYFEQLLKPLGVRVRCHAGYKGQRSLQETVLVCTYEKANVLVNTLAQEGRLSELGLFIVDELHQIGEGSRGQVVELLLSKVLFRGPDGRRSEQEISPTKLHDGPAGPLCQVVGMSATLPNASELAKWMGNAHLFATDFRPVPLEEHYVIDGAVFSKSHERLRAVEPTRVPQYDPEGYATALVAESTSEGHQTLVFCATKKQCELSALALSRALKLPSGVTEANTTTAPGSPAEESAEVAKARRRIAMLMELKAIPGGMDPTLEEVFAGGVGFHHAGLTSEEKTAVELAFRQKLIYAVCCTTTLAAGVNLPARRVVFRTPKIATGYISVVQYRQAAGRAGRAGLDVAGESFIVGTAQDSARLRELMNAHLPAVASTFSSAGRGLVRALLETIAAQVALSVYDIQAFLKRTFLAAQESYEAVHSIAQEALRFLEKNEFVKWMHSSECFEATAFGKATMAASLSPEEALIVFEELQGAKRAFNVEDELFLVYHLTPPFAAIEPSWSWYCNSLYAGLDSRARQVAASIGIDEGFLHHAATFGPKGAVGRKVTRHRRFYVALILDEVIKETSVSDVATRFNLQRGEVQRLMESAASFASMVSTFAEKLNWWFFPPIMDKMRLRMLRGVEQELLPLMKIAGLMPWRARALYKAGLRTPIDVAEANLSQLERIFVAQCPFVTREQQKEAGMETNHASLAKTVKYGARRVLREEAADLNDTYVILAKSLGIELPLDPAGRSSVVSNLADSVKKLMGSQASSNGSGTAVSAVSAPVPKEGSAVQTDNAGVRYKLTTESQAPARRSRSDLEGQDVQRGGATSTVRPAREPEPEYTLVSVTPEELTAFIKEADVASNEVHLGVSYGMAHVHEAPSTASSSEGERVVVLALATTTGAVMTYPLTDKSRAVVVRKLFESPRIIKHLHDAKSHCRTVHRLGVHPAAIRGLSDPIVAEWAANPDDHPHGFAPPLHKMMAAASVKEVRLCENSAFHKVAAVALNTLRLGMVLEERLSQIELLGPYRSIEMPLVPILCSMEEAGVGFSFADYKEKQRLMERKIEVIDNHVDALVAAKVQERRSDLAHIGKIDLRSPSDCAKLLFDVLRYPQQESTNAKKVVLRQRRKRVGVRETRSTNAAVLARLERAFPDDNIFSMIREHRTLVGWLAKYIEPLIAVSHPAPDGAAGSSSTKKRGRSDDEGNKDSEESERRIFGTFFQIASATGRLSMNDPSLQTIPHPVTFCLAGREVELRLRKAFVPTRGCVLVSADYSQIEARILAHFSGDSGLHKLFADPERDIFILLASEWLGVAEADVTQEQRRRVKTLFYGIVYGKGKATLADDLEVEPDAAEELLTGFKVRFASAFCFTETCVQSCRREGYITTLTGRRRYLPTIRARNEKVKAAAERAAVNSVCQGSAADLMKVAMIRISRNIANLSSRVRHQKMRAATLGDATNGDNSVVGLPVGHDFWVARMVLQVHDELLLEVRTEWLDEVCDICVNGMAHSLKLNVPLPVKIRVGPTWDSLELRR